MNEIGRLMELITEQERRKIMDDIHNISSRIAQEVFVERRKIILQKIQDATGHDLSVNIPISRKGRPSKSSRPF